MDTCHGAGYLVALLLVVVDKIRFNAQSYIVRQSVCLENWKYLCNSRCQYVGTIHLCINDVECTSAMRGKTSPNHYTTTSVLHSWYGIFID